MEQSPERATDPKAGPKYVRGVLAKEIAHRRERRQQVFSWGSSLLVAVTGGTIALTFKEQHPLSELQKLVLSVAIGVLGVHSILWIDHHWKAEKNAKSDIKPYNELLGVPAVDKQYSRDWTTIIALALLTAAALSAVWMPI